MDKSLVSIIIPTYNRSHLLHKPIESILKQTYQNFEILVVDDRSSDNSRELIQSYSQKDPRVKYVLNTRKKGPAGARNMGITCAKGKYIAFLDSDDQWLGHHLASSIKLLEECAIQACYAFWIEIKDGIEIPIGETEEIQEKMEQSIRKLNSCNSEEYVIYGQGFLEYAIKELFYCYHINTLVLKRKIIDQIGMFNEELFTSEDIDFTFRILSKFNVGVLKDSHFIYNEGTDNLYSYIDRDNINIEDIIEKPQVVNRLTFDGINKNKMRYEMKKLVRKTEGVEDKKGCIRLVNERISRKYFTLSYINNKYDRGAAKVFAIKALIYNFKVSKLVYLMNILVGKNIRIDNIVQDEFDFN